METDKEQPEKQEEHLAEYGITEAKREKKKPFNVVIHNTNCSRMSNRFISREFHTFLVSSEFRQSNAGKE